MLDRLYQYITYQKRPSWSLKKLPWVDRHYQHYQMKIIFNAICDMNGRYYIYVILFEDEQDFFGISICTLYLGPWLSRIDYFENNRGCYFDCNRQRQASRALWLYLGLRYIFRSWLISLIFLFASCVHLIIIFALHINSCMCFWRVEFLFTHPNMCLI